MKSTAPALTFGAMARRFNPEALLPIEVELAKEKASALGAVGARLDKMIAELHTLAKRPDARTQYTALRERALHERWKLIVQREAMGLSGHEDVDRLYAIPPRWS